MKLLAIAAIYLVIVYIIYTAVTTICSGNGRRSLTITQEGVIAFLSLVWPLWTQLAIMIGVIWIAWKIIGYLPNQEDRSTDR